MNRQWSGPGVGAYVDERSTEPQLLAVPVASEDVRMLPSEPCSACGHANEPEAAECRSCGASLVLQLSPTSRGDRRGPPGESFWSAEGGPLMEEALDYAPGEEFAGRYTIIDRLGQGGMGVVYKARDRELNRTVALKMIRASLERDPEAVQRFRREPGLAQQVTHKNVCRVHDLGVFDSVRFLSMEYLDADTLAQLLDKLGALSLRQSLEIGVQIVAALEAIHVRGIIHRDLKPSNIAVDASQRVVVMDFGLARGPIDSEVTRPGVLVGSYAYLAPEHIRGEPLTAAADVYALGLVLYEMLTGRRPPGDDDLRPLALRGDGAACPPPSAHDRDVPVELDDVVMKCLAWQAEDRPPVEEVGRVLGACLETERTRRVPRRRRRPAATRLAGIVAALVAAAALAAALLGGWGLQPAGPRAETTLALLPFVHEGESPGDAYLSRLAEDAIAASLRAAPELAVKRAEGDLGKRPPAEVARSLDVAWTLAGRVQRRNGSILVVPVLTDAEGREVWRGSFEGEAPIPVMEELRRALLARFGRDPDEVASVAELRTASLPAYQSFLEARRHHEGWFSETGFDEARRLYQEAIELDPQFAAAHAGQALASVGQYLRTGEESDRAVARYAVGRALSFGGNLAESHIASGTVLAGERRWEDAKVALRRGLDLAAGDDAVRRNLADLYETLGRPEEAKALYEEAIAAAPGYWENYYWYGGFLYRTGNLEAAPVYLRRAAELNPEAEGPITLLGFYALSSGDLEEARERFTRALEVSPDLDARHRLGLVAYYGGQLEEALSHWTVILEEEPERPSAHADVGDALRQLGLDAEASAHYREALARYERALAAAPNDDQLVAERAHVLAAAGRCDEARAGMEEVLEEHPANTDFLFYGALTAGRCGMNDWAVQLVLRSIGAGNVVGIWFDPDLEAVRKDPRVARALELIGFRAG